MKTYILTAALSVLTLGYKAEAQDGKILTAKAKIAEEVLASLPTQDTNVTAPTTFYSARELSMIALLPITDVNVELPTSANETVVANAPAVLPTTPKAESKVSETRRADK